GLAEVPGQPAGVDAGDAGDAAAGEHGPEVLLRPPVGAAAGEVAHDHPPAVDPGCLVVERVGPVVADVRIGEGDDLARVGRIGDHLLVAGQHGVEDDLAARDGHVG